MPNEAAASTVNSMVAIYIGAFILQVGNYIATVFFNSFKQTISLNYPLTATTFFYIPTKASSISHFKTEELKSGNTTSVHRSGPRL